MITFNVVLGYQGLYSETSCNFFISFFFFVFQSDQPTQYHETHSTLNEKKGRRPYVNGNLKERKKHRVKRQ